MAFGGAQRLRHQVNVLFGHDMLLKDVLFLRGKLYSKHVRPLNVTVCVCLLLVVAGATDSVALKISDLVPEHSYACAFVCCASTQAR